MANQDIVKINMGKYKRVCNVDTPFWEDLYKYYENPSKMNLAEYNLICSKRDITLWTKRGMKPNSTWRVTDLKKYFNIQGTKESLLIDFMEVYDEYHLLKKEILNVSKQKKQIQLTN
jgi:hypothetical protein